MDITRPCLVRIARRAGIKSISKDCFPLIQKLISDRLDKVVQNAIIINEEKGTKTLMASDVYDALAFLGENLTHSENLPENVVTVRPKNISIKD